MRIAVSTDGIWDVDKTSITLALNLLPKLPDTLQDHAIIFHDNGEKTDLGEIPLIDRFENAEADTYLSFHHGYFQDIPGTTVVFDINDFIIPSTKFLSLFGFKEKNNVLDLNSEAKLIVTHEKLRHALIDHGISAAKIINVGFGLPDNENRITPADQVTRRITKEVYGREHSYFYAPATGHESDNLQRLFAAYDLFRARCPEPVRLLVQLPEYGSKHSRAVRKAQRQATHSDDIVFLPHLSAHDHRNVFSSARAILYPSLSTRFPLPVLDAWTAEIPVLATDKNILQGGGALVQGELVESIAEGMVALVTTPFLASGLVENGKRRLQDFSWDRVAERVAAVLRSVAEEA